MWYRVKLTRDIEQPSGRMKHSTEYYLCDTENFAEAGYKVLQHTNGQGEIEDVCLMKSFKPSGNQKYNENNKVFIVKFAQDFVNEDGTIKTQKYPVPFYANNNNELQVILDLYIKQGLEGMRVTTVSETNWIIL